RILFLNFGMVHSPPFSKRPPPVTVLIYITFRCGIGGLAGRVRSANKLAARDVLTPRRVRGRGGYRPREAGALGHVPESAARRCGRRNRRTPPQRLPRGHEPAQPCPRRPASTHVEASRRSVLRHPVL